MEAKILLRELARVWEKILIMISILIGKFKQVFYVVIVEF